MKTRLPATLPIAPLSLAVAVLGALAACHPHQSEPRPVAVDASPTPHDLHHIVEKDHRHTIYLRVADKIALPADTQFDWSIKFEDEHSFVLFTGDAGQGPDPAYRAEKSGVFRMMVFGDPKCAKQDGGCGLSKRRWDIIAQVQ